MMNIENPQPLSKKSEEVIGGEKPEASKVEVIADVEKIALKIVEDFAEYFPNHKIIYKGQQVFPNTPIDELYLFNVGSETSRAFNTTFSVNKLDIQSVGETFVETLKNYGEDVVNTKEYRL